MIIRTALATAFLACTLVEADQEASNVPVIRTDEWGRCYAKSVPRELYGSKGTTQVYAVHAGADTLLSNFDWFAARVYLHCGVGRDGENIGTSVVRLGRWARGHSATAGELAIAFYFNGQLVKQYSTLDIAGNPDNVNRSVSHYTVIQTVHGYRQQKSNFYTFEVLTSEGKRIIFDPVSGEILSR